LRSHSEFALSFWFLIGILSEAKNLITRSLSNLIPLT
jgi:hypothetical protein